MICPQTQAECQYNCDYLMQRQCSFTPPPVAGRTLAADCAPTRGHAMLAEIERLVDAHGETVQALCNFDECGTGNGRPELESEFDAARAALMAAIRLYVQE